MAGNQDFKLDLATHDLEISDYDFVMIEEQDRIRQEATIHLLTARGEWFLNILHGVPYFQDIWVKDPDRSLVDAVFKAELMKVDDVTAITSFSIDLDAATRIATITFSVTTTFGRIADITVEG